MISIFADGWFSSLFPVKVEPFMKEFSENGSQKHLEIHNQKEMKNLNIFNSFCSSINWNKMEFYVICFSLHSLLGFYREICVFRGTKILVFSPGFRLRESIVSRPYLPSNFLCFDVERISKCKWKKVVKSLFFLVEKILYFSAFFLLVFPSRWGLH
jgi:hypothetical protein